MIRFLGVYRRKFGQNSTPLLSSERWTTISDRTTRNWKTRLWNGRGHTYICFTLSRGNVYDETLRGVWPLTVSIDDASSGKHRNLQLCHYVLRCHKVFIVKLWKEGRLNYLGFMLTRVPNMLTELHCNQSLKPYTVHQGFVSPWTLQGYEGYFSLFTIPLLAVCCLLFTNLQVICQWHSINVRYLCT